MTPTLTKYTVPRELVSEAFEGQVDFAWWRILDKACPREKLGLGVPESVLHRKNDTRFHAGGSEATGARDVGAATGAQEAAAEVVGASASGSTDCAVVVAAPSAVSELPQPTRATLRQLSRLMPDDSDAREKRRRQVTVALVERVKKVAAEGRYSGPDADDSTPVEFWARSVL